MRTVPNQLLGKIYLQTVKIKEKKNVISKD